MRSSPSKTTNAPKRRRQRAKNTKIRLGDAAAARCDTNLEQELVTIGELTPALLRRTVERIRLVGSFDAGRHQELRVRCREGRGKAWLRISRVDGADTLQVAEREEDFDALPTLLEVNKFLTPITLSDVRTAFELSRSSMKRYDQGDSQSLSQNICEELVLGALSTELDW